MERFLARTYPRASNSSWRWAGENRSWPSLPVRMMEESEGAGLDVVDDVDCIRDYVCYLCPAWPPIERLPLPEDGEAINPRVLRYFR